MELEDIRKHWEEAGNQFPMEGNITPTSRDPYLGLLERENILSFLQENHVVLEVGCGDGSHTVHYARRVKDLWGLDIAESLISIARKRAASESMSNVDFVVASVLDLGEVFKTRQFSCVVSQRCLINLPTWRQQQDAILRIHGVLQEGGLFLLTEGFQGELDNLNGIRQGLGLPEIRPVSYNRNLVREDFEPFAEQLFDVLEVRHYGVYLFLSRVYHPLAVLPDEPRHDSKLNEIALQVSQAVQVSDLEKYSYNLFYVLRKKR